MSLVDLEIGFFWRGDNRDIERLGILFHHECLDTLSINLLSIRVVLLVFVEHDLLPMSEVVLIGPFTVLVDLHQLLLASC